MNIQCPWLRILLLAVLVFSLKCQAQNAASVIELPDKHLTYDSALQLIGKQLHALPSHGVDCPELYDTCPLHGKMSFGKFFAPLRSKGLKYQFTFDIPRQCMMLIITRALPKPILDKTFTAWVVDEKGEPLASVFAQNLATGKKKSTDGLGMVSFDYETLPVQLFLTYVGRKSALVTILKDSMTFSLAIDAQALGAATVFYLPTRRAVATSGYSTVVDNAMSYPYYGATHELSGISTATVQTMLEGQMPGVLATQTSGIPGSSSYLSIRGQASIVNGIDPLYVIDGIPAAAGNVSLSNIQSGNASMTLSSWTFIAPADIERIDVLKDGDATAIYGSRGANGVVLVTTKQWKMGLPKLDVEVSTGVSKVMRQAPFMNTSEYLAMRREALQNSHLPLNDVTAPDIGEVDTSRNSDWGKWLLGRDAHSTNIRISVSGGAPKNNYTVGMDYLKEITPFPTQPGHHRITTNFNYNHRSEDRRWTLQVQGLAGWDANHQCIIFDPTIFRTLDPAAPPPLNPSGQLNFPTGLPYGNPLGFLRQPYEAVSGNYLLSLTGSYALSGHFFCKTTTGFNHLRTREFGAMPLADQNPAFDPTATGFFSVTDLDSRIFEPQLEYRRQDGGLSLNWVGGASLQRWEEHTAASTDTGYANDRALLHHDHALVLYSSADTVHDVYNALFTNLNANWNDRYILNITARRDGSSRFPVNHRYGGFGSIALAWVFADAHRTMKLLPFVTYGKIKVSEGVTGNNQIGGRSLQNFAGTSIQSFQSISGLYTANTPGVGWEKTYKSELSLDLGFWRNRILFNATAYRHYSDNCFQNGEFPMTGVGQTATVLSATLANYGYELSLSATLADKNYFGWEIAVNWTSPKNRLVSFPRLDKSIYAGRLMIGESINVLRGYVYKGVDQQSGLYRFADLNGDGRISEADEKVVGKFDVTGFGGFGNTIRWRQFQLRLLVDVRLATGLNYLAPIFANCPPGSIDDGLSSNVPRVLLDHWRQPGDRAAYQKLYAAPDVNADSTMVLYLNSSALLANTSFLRLRKLSIGYELPAARAAAMHLSSLLFFADAQNLLVLSPYKADPEIQSLLTMPTTRTIEVGVRLTR